jgi:hypothetical protein
MTQDGAEGKQVPRRFRRLKFNPLRDVLPIVAVIVGADLVVVAVVVFFINRWQAKRGL